jgi:hypothetical protein
VKIAALILVLAAALIAGCSSDHAQKPVVRNEAPPEPPRLRAVPARPREVALIRRWADTLRAGRVTGASRLFRVPAIAENGTGELALQSFEDVQTFNSSLPCGAVLLDAKRVAHDYTIGVFRLTDRPGGDCGTGTGQRAATAFAFKDGRISEWRRVPVPEFAPVPPAPQV